MDSSKAGKPNKPRGRNTKKRTVEKHHGFEPKMATHVYMVDGKQLGEAIVTETAFGVEITLYWAGEEEPSGAENWVNEILESYCRNKPVFLERDLFHAPGF